MSCEGRSSGSSTAYSVAMCLTYTPRAPDVTLGSFEATACGLLARRGGEGRAHRPAAPRRSPARAAPVRWEGDGRPGAHVSALGGRRPSRLVVLGPPRRLAVSLRPGHLPRAAVPDRRRRQRARPLRHDRLVGRLQPLPQLGILVTAFGQFL